VLVGDSGLPIIPAAILGVGVSMIVGVLIEAIVYEPLARRSGGGSNSLLLIFVASLGIVIAGENLVRLVWGNNTRTLPGFPPHTFSVSNVNFTSLDITLVIVSILLIGGLTLLLARTVLGEQIRAVRGNPEMALAVGVDVRRIYWLVFAIGTMIAGVAAIFDGMKFAVTPNLGDQPVFYAFVVAFLAGVSSSPIRVGLVGLMIGVIERVSTLWVSDKLSALSVFGLLFIFLAATSVPRGLRQVSAAFARGPRLAPGETVSRA
jgi:branched-subunit amino acid ABC-type transport system permease component